MSINFDHLRKAALVLLALSFFQLPVLAQSPPAPNETVVDGQTNLVGLIQGETLRFTAFNPIETDGGKANEPITLQLKLYDQHGDVIAVSPKVVIPPGEFRSVEFNRDDLPLSGEPGTTRAQLRTKPLWGLAARGRLIHVSTSLEILNNSTGATFKFYFNVEALP